MKGIVDYFVSNPEAIATLLVFFAGGLASITALLYALFARHPIIVRYLENRSLVYIDPVLQRSVRASFRQGDTETEIHELRQVDFEIYNSHPKNRVEKRKITIGLPTPDVRILGVTVANSDDRTPLLGGRPVTSTLLQVPLVPNDPLLRIPASLEYPAVVVDIPYLEPVLENDRILIRISYDGPYVQPKIQGAKLESKSGYEIEQRRTVALLASGFAFAGLLLMFLAYQVAGVPFINLSVVRQPYYLVGTALGLVGFLILILILFSEEWALNGRVRSSHHWLGHHLVKMSYRASTTFTLTVSRAVKPKRLVT